MKKSLVKYSLIVVFIVALLFSLSGCTACAKRGWQEAYDAYTNEKYKDRIVFQSFKATITQETFDKIKTGFEILIDVDDFNERYSNYPNVQAAIAVYQTHYFYFVDESIPILEQAGFFNDINENTVITFTVNSYIGWDGWCYPVFAVAIGEKTYLDFETGKGNVLNYVKQRIEDPLGN